MHSSCNYDELKKRLRGEDDGANLAIAEDSAPFPEALAPLNEKLIQLIWQEQLLDPERLVTPCGKPVRIIDPGRWTGERGPDFHHAELEIGGVRLRGDVEIHLDAADWDRHGHQHDFEYNSTVLHVALTASDGRRHDRLHNGDKLERLLIESAITPDLQTVRHTFAGDDTMLGAPDADAAGMSACQQSLTAADPNLVRELFGAAARQRMEAKAARHQAQLRMESSDQTLYQAIMTAMGYKGGKTLFFLLAKRAPIEEMKFFLRNVPLTRLAQDLESILLHVANLLPAEDAIAASARPDDMFGQDDEPPSGEAPGNAARQPYLDALRESWGPYRALYLDRILPPTRRWFSSVRPVNFPMRRIAGVAQLLAQFDFRRGLMEQFVARFADSMARQPKTSRDFRREIKSLAGLFEANSSSFWTHHYTFASSTTTAPMQLIGEDRSLSVLYNALLPLILLHARQQNDPELENYVWRLHGNFPALPANTVTRFMRRRLFGAAEEMEGMTFRLEAHNQAMFQIFHECCSDQSLTCEDCVFRRCGSRPGT